MQNDPKLTAEIVLAAVELMGRAGRQGTVVVQGESMRPTLRPGQLLAVEFSPGATARGDLLVFRQGETLLVHRQVGPAPSLEGRPRLRTRGDGVLVFDPPVELERIVARVVAFKDGERWRSTQHRAARVYARCLAWHDLFWGAVGVVLRRLELRLNASRTGLRLRPAARAVDRVLLRCVHRLLSRRMQPTVAKPDGA